VTFALDAASMLKEVYFGWLKRVRPLIDKLLLRKDSGFC
jgi:hypothetical protein